jgi:uncharacterized membrane protein YhaH (DUF805 family)
MKNFFDLARPMGRLQYLGIILANAIGNHVLAAVDTPAVGKFVVEEFGGVPGVVVAVALMKLAFLAIVAVAVTSVLRRATDLAWSTRSKAILLGMTLFSVSMQETLTAIKIDSFFDDGGPRFLLALLVAATALAFLVASMGFGLTLATTAGKLWRSGAMPALKHRCAAGSEFTLVTAPWETSAAKIGWTTRSSAVE